LAAGIKARSQVIRIRDGDCLAYKGWVVDAAVLAAIVGATDKRLLWRFARDGSRIRPVALTEKQVIWLDEDGL
jgi:hypothetical protein